MSLPARSTSEVHILKEILGRIIMSLKERWMFGLDEGSYIVWGMEASTGKYKHSRYLLFAELSELPEMLLLGLALVCLTLPSANVPGFYSYLLNSWS